MILSVEEIEFSYSSRTILDKVGFSVQRGELLSILGNNGAEKSILLKTLNREPKGRDSKLGKCAYRIAYKIQLRQNYEGICKTMEV